MVTYSNGSWSVVGRDLFSFREVEWWKRQRSQEDGGWQRSTQSDKHMSESRVLTAAISLLTERCQYLYWLTLYRLLQVQWVSSANFTVRPAYNWGDLLHNHPQSLLSSQAFSNLLLLSLTVGHFECAFLQYWMVSAVNGKPREENMIQSVTICPAKSSTLPHRTQVNL